MFQATQLFNHLVRTGMTFLTRRMAGPGPFPVPAPARPLT